MAFVNGYKEIKRIVYEKGFVHAKCYLVDGETAMVGTINMDYRSLVHHFENGVWLHKTKCIDDIKVDMLDTKDKSIFIEQSMVKTTLFQRFLRSIFRIFAPLL